MSATPFDILERIIEILDELGIPYALGGSFAASFFGEPRESSTGSDWAVGTRTVSGTTSSASCGSRANGSTERTSLQLPERSK